jgi:hypothetical protein
MLHRLKLGHFDTAAAAQGRIVVLKPLDSATVCQLLREVADVGPDGEIKIEGYRVEVKHGYVDCPWLMPTRIRKCEEFARRLSKATGCVMIDGARVVSPNEFEIG